MYNRRKLLLALIEAHGGQLERLRLQKLLFLLSSELEPPPYHFLPYLYGCFSFQANMDLLVLRNKGIVREDETTWRIGGNGWIEQLTTKELGQIINVRERFGGMTDSDLIRYTYIHFPFYAIRSTICDQYLTTDECRAIRELQPTDSSPLLLTLGYEGMSLEEYLNILLRWNVRLLCDVRRNAMSMKYGFSKGTLRKASANVGIEYVHTPELGIAAPKRRGLQTPADYDALFGDYRKTTLRETTDIQKQLACRITKAGRAALLCFEKDPRMCHRSHLADQLIGHLSSDHILIHTGQEQRPTSRLKQGMPPAFA